MSEKMYDCHVNLWLEEHVSPEFEVGMRERGYKCLPADPKSVYDALAKAEKVIVFALKYKHSLGIESPDTLTAQAVKRYPDKFIGFANVDPTRIDMMADLEYAHQELKLTGVKTGPIYQDYHVLDERAQPFFSYCQKNNLPVTMHMGMTYPKNTQLEYGRPIHIDTLARRYPDLKIIMAHIGHPWCGECLATVRKHSNVYTEMTGLNNRNWMLYQALVTAQEYGVAHKIFWGTDYPFSDFDEARDCILNINQVSEGTRLPKISQENIEKIIYSNPLEHWWH